MGLNHNIDFKIMPFNIFFEFKKPNFDTNMFQLLQIGNYFVAGCFMMLLIL